MLETAGIRLCQGRACLCRKDIANPASLLARREYAYQHVNMHVVNTLSSACASVSGMSVCLTQSSDDPTLGDLVLAFEAFGVDAEQDRDAVAGLLGDLSWATSPLSRVDRQAWRRS